LWRRNGGIKWNIWSWCRGLILVYH
jgi:hypothetical protein